MCARQDLRNPHLFQQVSLWHLAPCAANHLPVVWMLEEDWKASPHNARQRGEISPRLPQFMLWVEPEWKIKMRSGYQADFPPIRMLLKLWIFLTKKQKEVCNYAYYVIMCVLSSMAIHGYIRRIRSHGDQKIPWIIILWELNPSLYNYPADGVKHNATPPVWKKNTKKE